MSKLENELPSSEPDQGSESVEGQSTPDLEMRRRAAAVLEVLGGAKSPVEAAEALDISLPRYYLLEARALEGLIAACEPRPRGRSQAEGRTAHSLKRENERLRHDLTRTQALARAVQRAAGMPEAEIGGAPTDGRVRRRRRPHARALRAARNLSADAIPATSASPPCVEPPHQP